MTEVNGAMEVMYVVISVLLGVLGAYVVIRQEKITPWRRRLLLGAVCTAAMLAASFGCATVNTAELVTAYISIFFLFWIAVTDATRFTIPNKIILAWLSCRAVLLAVSVFLDQSLDVLVLSAGGALVMGFLFLLVYYLSKRTLGGGDVKLSFVMGLSLTMLRVFNAMFYGLVCCALFAGVGLLLKKLTRKDVLPLGPFLFVGTVIAYLLQIGVA